MKQFKYTPDAVWDGCNYPAVQSAGDKIQFKFPDIIQSWTLYPLQLISALISLCLVDLEEGGYLVTYVVLDAKWSLVEGKYKVLSFSTCCSLIIFMEITYLVSHVVLARVEVVIGGGQSIKF